MRISVIITNWNGLKLLKKNLETIILNSPEADEFILADDASSDSSVKYAQKISQKYKKLKIIAQKQNLGFGANSNQAVMASSGEYVVLLNNDINPQKGYITAALKNFKDTKVFGVGFAEIGNENWPRIYWKFGSLQYEAGKITDKTHIAAWISGGGSIIKKDLFLKLNGFDDAYQPFYSEDLDLGLRAWKSGYTLLWEPTAKIYHNHESTMSRFPKRHLEYVKERNRLLVTWRNFTQENFKKTNFWWIIGRILSGPNYLKIVLSAKKQMSKSKPPVFIPVRSEQEILDLFSK